VSTPPAPTRRLDAPALPTSPTRERGDSAPAPHCASPAPWAALHQSLARWRAAATDADALLAAAQALTNLALTTAARDHLALLPQPGAPPDSNAAPPDAPIPADHLIATAQANARALSERGVELSLPFDAWRARLAHTFFYRAADGNVVRRRLLPGLPPSWSRFNDDLAAAQSVPLALADPSDPIGRDAKPVILEGLDPPWLFGRVMRLTPPSPAGYQPWVVLVQADPLQFLDGLALADLRTELADPRLSVFVGPTAGSGVLAFLRARLGTSIQATPLRLPTTAARTNPPLEQVLTQALREQEADLASLLAQNRRTYAGRDATWWSRRFSDPGSTPLRALIPTTRYSTFVRHSAQDLAAALREAGWRAEVLEEPDPSSQHSTNGYARAVRALEPDLVVLINYERVTVAHAMPAETPVLTWVQDSLPHLFEGRAGGPLDLVAGCISAGAMEARGYRPGHAREAPVPARAAKFHVGHVDANARARLTCDVAYVGHQSRTPEEFLRAGLAAVGDDPIMHRVLESLYVRTSDAAARVLDVNLFDALAGAVHGAWWAATGEAPPAERARRLLFGHAVPLADRLLRHTTLAWVAEICRRRGWSFHLYGTGWERHPTLSAYARGAVEHGEELRGAYSCARAHVHVSSTAMAHQRVFECALSGGLPLCRLALPELQQWSLVGAWWAMERAGTRPRHDREAFPTLAVADSPELMMATRVRQLVRGGEAPAVVDPNTWPGWLRAALRRDDPPDRRVMAAWVIGDLSESCFWDRASLEARLERAVTRPEWRDDLSRGIAERACTAEAFARSIPGWVARAFHAGTAAAAA